MSEDGFTWVQHSSPKPSAMCFVVYGNNRFLAVGEDKSYFIIDPVSKISPLPSSTFRQSIIDYTTMNNAKGNSKQLQTVKNILLQ
jgi:hypothetical protein